MTKLLHTRTLHWVLAALAIGLGFSPEAVLCVSTAHVTVETSACCAPGALAGTPGAAAAVEDDLAGGPCGPCVDVPLETGVFGREHPRLCPSPAVDHAPVAVLSSALVPEVRPAQAPLFGSEPHSSSLPRQLGVVRLLL